jgi:hypothetical protein
MKAFRHLLKRCSISFVPFDIAGIVRQAHRANPMARSIRGGNWPIRGEASQSRHCAHAMPWTFKADHIA